MSDDLYKDYKTIVRKPLIIFDLDGTLVDCKGLHQWCFRKAVEDVNQSVEFTDQEVEGMPTKDKIKYLRSKGHFIPNTVNDIKQRYTVEHVKDHVKYSKEFKEALYALTKYYNLSLASNARKEFVLTVLRITDLWPWSCFLTPDYGPSKPDPWMFKQCMHSSFATEHTTMIFEDSPLGIECAKSTGAMVVEVEDSSDTLKKIKQILKAHENNPNIKPEEVYDIIKTIS